MFHFIKSHMKKGHAVIHTFGLVGEENASRAEQYLTLGRGTGRQGRAALMLACVSPLILSLCACSPHPNQKASIDEKPAEVPMEGSALLPLGVNRSESAGVRAAEAGLGATQASSVEPMPAKLGDDNLRGFSVVEVVPKAVTGYFPREVRTPIVDVGSREDREESMPVTRGDSL